MSENNQIYSKAPLVETVFEIRFRGNLSIECNRDKFYEKISNDYPDILVPKVSTQDSMPLVPYRFQKSDASGLVMVSIASLALSIKKYEGFNLFKKEILRVFSFFSELFDIQDLSRTGLRYINIIPFTREGDIIPIRKYLNIDVKLPENIPTDFTNFNSIFVSKTKAGNIATRIQPIIAPDKTKEALILDFDYAKEGQLKFDSIDKYLVESHKYTKDLFEKIMTAEYKKVMRGDVI